MIPDSVVVVEPQGLVQPPPIPPLPAEVSLRLGVYPPSQLLQTDGRLRHLVLASLVDEGITKQQGPFAPRALPRFLANTSPSATLSPSTDFPVQAGYTASLTPEISPWGEKASPGARHFLVHFTLYLGLRIFLNQATYPQTEVRSIRMSQILSSLSLGKTRIVQT